MPDPGDLDTLLTRARADVLDSVTAPPLAALRRRATAKRRARTTIAGSVLTAAVAATVLAARPWAPAAVAPATGNDAGGVVYTADRITLIGLRDERLDLPGSVGDVQFTDRRHGYLLTFCPPAGEDGCRPALARSADGGHGWTSRELPRDVTDPQLLTFPDGTVAVRGSSAMLVVTQPDGWHRIVAGPSRRAAAVAPDQVLRLPDPDGHCARPLEVWDPRRGPVGPLAAQPGFPVCWVAAAPTADGAWWVGGRQNDRPVVAVSRDAGRSWQAVTLPLPDGDVTSVRVTTLGRHVWATVDGTSSAEGFRDAYPPGALRGIYHSADAGRTFTATRRLGADDPPPEPRYVTGAVVPLLDGRIMVAGPGSRWYVSADDGASFRHAAGTLPPVERLSPGGAGYVAHGLFNAGWTAFSTDGQTWHKLPIR